MAKSAAATAVTTYLWPPIAHLFLGLFILYLMHDILDKFLGFGEKKK